MSKKLKELLSFLNGFRKFTTMFAILVTAIVFRILGLINGLEFVDLIKITGVAFFGTNAAEHLTNTVKMWLSTKVKSEIKKRKK